MASRRRSIAILFWLKSLCTIVVVSSLLTGGMPTYKAVIVAGITLLCVEGVWLLLMHKKSLGRKSSGYQSGPQIAQTGRDGVIAVYDIPCRDQLYLVPVFMPMMLIAVIVTSAIVIGLILAAVINLSLKQWGDAMAMLSLGILCAIAVFMQYHWMRSMWLERKFYLKTRGQELIFRDEGLDCSIGFLGRVDLFKDRVATMFKTGRSYTFIPWNDVEEFSVRPTPIGCRGDPIWLIKLRGTDELLGISRVNFNGIEAQLIELIKPRISCPIVVEDDLR